MKCTTLASPLTPPAPSHQPPRQRWWATARFKSASHRPPPMGSPPESSAAAAAVRAYRRMGFRSAPWGSPPAGWHGRPRGAYSKRGPLLRRGGPNHLGLWVNGRPSTNTARITSGCGFKIRSGCGRSGSPSGHSIGGKSGYFYASSAPVPLSMFLADRPLPGGRPETSIL